MVLVVVVMLALLAGQQAGGSGRAGEQEAGRKASSWTVVGNHSVPAGVVHNNSFVSFVCVLPVLLQVQGVAWTRAYDNTIAAVLPIEPEHQDTHALAPGAVELPVDLSFPEDFSSASFKAHATTCHTFMLEESCPDQQQALAALWAHLATCPGPVQDAIEAPQPQGHMCQANWTTPASRAVAPDAKEEQAVCPAAYFLGANTTTTQALEVNNTDINTVYTPNTYKKLNTWSVCAAALCTLAGILALALRRSMSTPPAPKKRIWDLELLQVMAKCLTGDPAKDARWARRQGEEGEGVELLEAIRAAGLYPSPPAKPPTPPRVAPKQSKPHKQSKESSPKQSKSRHQPKPTPPVSTPPTDTPAPAPRTTRAPPPPPPPSTPPPVLRLSPHNPWAPLPSPHRRRDYKRGSIEKHKLPGHFHYRQLCELADFYAFQQPEIAVPKPPLAPKKTETHRHQPTKPVAFFSKPARAAFIAELPSPGKPKPLQVAFPILEPPAPHADFTFSRLAPSSPTMPIFGRRTCKEPEFSFHGPAPTAHLWQDPMRLLDFRLPGKPHPEALQSCGNYWSSTRHGPKGKSIKSMGQGALIPRQQASVVNW
jgi:hypothetical protein